MSIGIELARQYYETYGRTMIEEQFPEYERRIAIGLVGPGSECFGFDDEISRDHDFEAGFCLWVTSEDEETIGFRLSRAYKKLPSEFMGIKKKAQSLFGGNRRGVLEIGEFYSRFTGSPGIPKDWRQWLAIPEFSLAEAVNGRVFRDDLGEFTRIREELKKGYPEDVRLKKLAARAALAAQAGQYNYSRCVSRGEYGAAGLAAGEFVKNAASMIYLLNHRYPPYYKWLLRGMKALPRLGGLAEPLNRLASDPLGYKGECGSSSLIEMICQGLIEELKHQKLSSGNWDYLEPHALEIMEHIKDGQIRSLHVMEG